MDKEKFGPEYTRAEQCIQELEAEGASVEVLGKSAIRITLPENVNLDTFWKGRLDLSSSNEKEDKIVDYSSVFHNFGIVVVDGYPHKIPDENQSIVAYSDGNYTDRTEQRFLPPQMPHFDNGGASKFFILQYPHHFPRPRHLKTGFINYISFAEWLSKSSEFDRKKAIAKIAGFEVQSFENRKKRGSSSIYPLGSLYNWKVWSELGENVIQVSLSPGSFVCVNQWIEPCYMHGRKSSVDQEKDRDDVLYRHFIRTIGPSISADRHSKEEIIFRLSLNTGDKPMTAFHEKTGKTQEESRKGLLRTILSKFN